MGYIKWLGHSAFEIVLDNIKLLIDPWLKDNPMSITKPDEYKDIELILVTHDHGDHLGDSIEISKNSGAKIVSIHEIAVYAQENGVEAIGMNIGGLFKYKTLEIVMTPAFHSSNMGSPVGFIIKGKEGTIYHAGDTGIYSDIKLYADLYPIDYALVPIGGHYTMDEEQAAYFISLFKPKYAIPMHYNTFPVIKAEPKRFENSVKKHSPTTQVIILSVGEQINI